MKHEILFASSNRHKVEEIQQVLEPLSIRLLSLKDFPDLKSPEEDGETFLENALIKARAAREVTGLPVLADDSGLVIPALGGEPGVHSARYAGPGAPAWAMMAKVLGKLRLAESFRTPAYFETVLVFQYGPDEYKHTRGVVEGRIAPAPRGTEGFGYDPIFIPNGWEKTFAEISLEEKNQLSHRSRALTAILPFLWEYLSRLR